MTKCPKCQGTLFKLEPTEPSGSAVKMFFVQCVACMTPVGITEYFTHATTIKKVEGLEKKFDALASELGNIDHMLRQIVSRMK